jgi:hypothetical protein
MLTKPANTKKAEVQAKVEAENKVLGLYSTLTSTSAYILLSFFASLKIPQPYLDCFPRNFCPADLRIFGEDCGCFGILNLQTQNLDNPVINLDICHGLLLVGEQ